LELLFQKKKFAEFEEMMKLPPCTLGKHKFAKNQKNGTKTCRDDWYQSQAYVSINIFAKNLEKDKSQIVIKENSVDVLLTFPDGFYQKQFLLSNTINPDKSSFSFLTTKVEIKLSKSDPIHWHYLTL